MPSNIRLERAVGEWGSNLHLRHLLARLTMFVRKVALLTYAESHLETSGPRVHSSTSTRSVGCCARRRRAL